MSTLCILFFVTQLEQCYNPFIIALTLLVSAISGISIYNSGNITIAVFGNQIDLHVGAGPMIYGALGGFFAYLAINW